MNIVRRTRNGAWDPMGELERIRQEIDEMFDPSARRLFTEGLFERDFSPALDVVEHQDSFSVDVDLPGVDKKDLDISVANNVLTIKGEKRESTESKGKVYRKETWSGSFQRTISLPRGVDAGKIDARMRDGVLTVTLPKMEEAKPRQIAVSVK
ncbi:MAG: Hsp20/alpha crystallin family protein [Spirochaetaceae bacterium]|nr:MAG: Hsp20/alpha crystallin family protein [Spirochaetaceae bacterium]